MPVLNVYVVRYIVAADEPEPVRRYDQVQIAAAAADRTVAVEHDEPSRCDHFELHAAAVAASGKATMAVSLIGSASTWLR